MIRHKSFKISDCSPHATCQDKVQRLLKLGSSGMYNLCCCGHLDRCMLVDDGWCISNQWVFARACFWCLGLVASFWSISCGYGRCTVCRTQEGLPKLFEGLVFAGTAVICICVMTSYHNIATGGVARPCLAQLPSAALVVAVAKPYFNIISVLSRPIWTL